MSYSGCAGRHASPEPNFKRCAHGAEPDEDKFRKRVPMMISKEAIETVNEMKIAMSTGLLIEEQCDPVSTASAAMLDVILKRLRGNEPHMASYYAILVVGSLVDMQNAFMRVASEVDVHASGFTQELDMLNMLRDEFGWEPIIPGAGYGEDLIEDAQAGMWEDVVGFLSDVAERVRTTMDERESA